MARIITRFEPLTQQTVPLNHPDIPGEQIVFTLYQRIVDSLFGTRTTADVSASARGSMSGRDLPAHTWTPQMHQAFEELSRAVTKQPSGFSMSAIGYVLIAIVLAILGGGAWQCAGVMLVDTVDQENYDGAKTRVRALAAAPSVGSALLVGEPDGRSFRWHVIRAADAERIELQAASTTVEMSVELVEPSTLQFDGATLSIPKSEFLAEDLLRIEGMPRIVFNATR